MEARGRRNWAQGIVRSQVNVMRLAPARDLPRLRDPTHVAEVNACVVDQFLLDQFPELPLARKLLPCRQRGRDVASKLAEGSGVLRTDRVLDEVRTIRLQRPAERDGERRIEPGVDVYADLDVISHGLSDGFELLDGFADGAGRIEHPPLFGNAESDKFPALRHLTTGVLRDLLRRSSPDPAVAHHLVPDQPAQQLIEGHAEPFCPEIPQRDVYGADGGGENLAAGEKSPSKHRLPEMLDARSILPDQKGFQMVHRLRNS